MAVDGLTKQYEISRGQAVLNDIITSDVTDPLTGNDARSSTGDWIFDGMPNPINYLKKDGWKCPIIIIEYPNLEEDKDKRVLDDSKVMTTLSCEIDVVGLTRSQTNLLAEKIRYQITQNIADLNTATMFNYTLTGTANDTEFIGSNKLYIKKLFYDFTRFD